VLKEYLRSLGEDEEQKAGCPSLDEAGSYTASSLADGAETKGE